MVATTDTRVFFALWPPAAVAQAIDAQADTLAIDGRRVARDRLHLTLAFHGRCNSAMIEQLKHRADHLAFPAFDLLIDRSGYFRRPEISWFGPSVTPNPLAALAAALAPSSQGRLQDSPASNRFTPHITVARKSAAITPAPIAPIVWSVDSFALIASGRNGAPGGYNQLAQWPLTTESVTRTRV